jgi:hypothetical protein
MPELNTNKDKDNSLFEWTLGTRPVLVTLVLILPTFCVQIFRTHVRFSLVTFLVTFLLWQKNLYKKRVHIMLMKLTAGVNFTNILRAAFLQMLLVKCWWNWHFACLRTSVGIHLLRPVFLNSRVAIHLWVPGTLLWVTKTSVLVLWL